MNYDEFKAEYENLLREMLKYTIEQVGSSVFAEKLSDLTDANPEHEARYDDEN